MTPTSAARPWHRVVNGALLAGVDQGAADPPAIVCLHGLASTHLWWQPVADRLTARYRVVRFDHRGHGRSGAADGPHTVDGLAADTTAVLENLGLSRVVLAGHSLGAAVALTAAATRPDLVAAVSCVDGGVYDPRQMFGATWEQARREMLTSRRGRTTPAVLRAWLAQADLPASLLPILTANYLDDGRGALRLRIDPAHETQLARSLWATDPLPLLAAVRVPVQIIAAHHDDDQHDRPRRESIRRARNLIGDQLQTRWLPGGHHLPLQRPTEVAQALAELAARTHGLPPTPDSVRSRRRSRAAVAAAQVATQPRADRPDGAIRTAGHRPLPHLIRQ